MLSKREESVLRFELAGDGEFRTDEQTRARNRRSDRAAMSSASASLPPEGSSCGFVTVPLHSLAVQRGVVFSGAADANDDGTWHDYRPPLVSTTDEANADRRAGKKRSLQSGRGSSQPPKFPGMHYVDVWIGTPTATKQTVAISTSSDYTVLPCSSDESSLGAPDGMDQYDAPGSDTFESVSCDMCFAEGSRCQRTVDGMDGGERCEVGGMLLSGKNRWTAYEARDEVFIGGPPTRRQDTDREEMLVTDSNLRLNLLFACELTATGFLINIRRTANGLLGMSTSRTSFINQLFATGKLTEWSFSLCFNRQRPPSDTIDDVADGPEEAQTTTGTMTLGGFDDGHLLTPMIYATNTQAGGAPYSMRLRAIYLRKNGGNSAVAEGEDQVLTKLDVPEEKLNGGSGVVLDSASPYTLLNNAVEGSFKEVWSELAGMDHTYSPIELTLEELEKLPTLVLQLQAADTSSDTLDLDPDSTPAMAGTDLDPEHSRDVLLAVPASHYMEYVVGGSYRNRISLKSSGGTILGANVLQGRHVNFDLTNLRIGFAEHNSCTGSGKRPSMGDAEDGDVGEMDDGAGPTLEEGSDEDLSPTQGASPNEAEEVLLDEEIPAEKSEIEVVPGPAPTRSPVSTASRTETSAPSAPLPADSAIGFGEIPGSGLGIAGASHIITPDMSFSFYPFYLGAAGFLGAVSLVLLAMAACNNKKRTAGGGPGPGETQPLEVIGEGVEIR